MMTNEGPTFEAIEREAEYRAVIDESRAMRDALRAIANDIPDPAVYARLISLAQAEMLLAASFHDSSYSVPHHHAHVLKPFGLVEAGTGKRCLTAFAIKVRSCLLEHDA